MSTTTESEPEHRPTGDHAMTPRAMAGGRLMVLAGILIFALSLRTAVTSITPLLARVGDEVGFGATVIGVFGMLPTAMFGLAGLVGPWATIRFGLERTTLAAVVATAVGIGIRPLMADTGSLLALSCLALLGMGIGNVVIPPLVKRYFSDRVALLSTVYLTSVQLGTAVPPLIAVPLAQEYGWRLSLGVWAIIPLIAILPWIGIVLSRRGHDARDVTGERADRATEPSSKPIWHSPLAWGMAAMFGMTSLNTYALFTWIPAILSEAGASASLGGAMVALFSGVGFVLTLIIPSLCSRMPNPFPLVIASMACFLASYAGLYFAPMTATWLWIVLAGIGPSTFPMALTLINLRTRSGAASASLSGFAQGVGYIAACVGPLGFGVLHEITGGWGAPFAMLIVCLVILTAGAYETCKPRMLEDTLA